MTTLLFLQVLDRLLKQGGTQHSAILLLGLLTPMSVAGVKRLAACVCVSVCVCVCVCPHERNQNG